MTQHSLDEIYTFHCYVRNDEPNLIHLKEPKPAWSKFFFMEPKWWEYDQILSDDCFKKMESTGKWTINEIKKRRLLLKKGLVRIETSDGQIFSDMQNISLDEEIGETIGIFYSERILLNENDKESIENDLENYNNEDKISVLKPPFYRMIIEMDIARRIGGYSREDILNLSKKDMDTIYFLHRLGMQLPIKDYARSIQNSFKNSNSLSESFQDQFEMLKRKSDEVKSILNNE